MNCCDDFSNCARGKDCPARPAMLEVPQPTAPMLDLADRARHTAAEIFHRPDYGRPLAISAIPAHPRSGLAGQPAAQVWPLG